LTPMIFQTVLSDTKYLFPIFCQQYSVLRRVLLTIIIVPVSTDCRNIISRQHEKRCKEKESLPAVS
jgi:hypothetical protein